MDKLQKAGVNMDRLQAYQKSYEEALMRQQAAPAEEESSVSLDEALGN